MTRQRESLARLVPVLCRKYRGCGILVFGSVGRGEEKPNSDLDVIVVHDDEGELEWMPGSPLGEPGLNLDLAIFPQAALRRLAATRWFAFWEFAQAEVVHDPTGIARRNQTLIRERFEAYPEAAAMWKELMAAVSRSKRGSGVTLPYGGRAGVEAYLERLFVDKGTSASDS